MSWDKSLYTVVYLPLHKYMSVSLYKVTNKLKVKNQFNCKVPQITLSSQIILEGVWPQTLLPLQTSSEHKPNFSRCALDMYCQFVSASS